MFIDARISEPSPIKSMPDVYRYDIASALKKIEALIAKGLNSILLFGIPKTKDNLGSEAYNPESIIHIAIRKIKSLFPDLVVIADCCLCDYTTDGNCYIQTNTGKINERETILSFQSIASSYADSGADIIAPSSMLDNVVSSIRESLDRDKFKDTLIMSYSIKYASCLYSAFRDASNSNYVGNRSHHQLSPTQSKEALREALFDEVEGADMLIIKPTLFYLDIVHTLSNKTNLPLIGYHVSSEYTMAHYAFEHNLIEKSTFLEEIYLSMARAGCSSIISYYTEYMLEYLNEAI